MAKQIIQQSIQLQGKIVNCLVTVPGRIQVMVFFKRTESGALQIKVNNISTHVWQHSRKKKLNMTHFQIMECCSPDQQPFTLAHPSRPHEDS